MFSFDVFHSPSPYLGTALCLFLLSPAKGHLAKTPEVLFTSIPHPHASPSLNPSNQSVHIRNTIFLSLTMITNNVRFLLQN